MSISATLKDLIQGCPRNIKRRLLRDILLILFITSGAILAIVLVQGVTTRHEISTTLINDSKRLVNKRFTSFVAPLENTMKLLAKWGESGLLKLDDLELLASQFQALMEIQPNISAISLADTEGKEVVLSHLENQWLLHNYQPEKVITAIWKNGSVTNREETPSTGYNPSQASWFRGAMTIKPAERLFWTDPYFLETTGETGVTASLRWSRRDAPNHFFISAFSLALQDLMAFMEQLEVTDNGHILLLQKSNTLLSNIRANTLRPSPVRAQPSKAPVPQQLFTIVTRKLQESSFAADKVVSIKTNGKNWWLGFTPLHDTKNDVWVAIIIPEDDIFSDLRRQWLRFAMIVGSILLAGIFMTVFLVRKYSHQLKDLPQQNITSQGYEHEITALIEAGESSTLEFKSTMRTNLKTGKPGKEIELAWLKGVVAFMNSDGGILLIGVTDDGTLLGTEADNFANEDKCRLHFKNLLNTHIGAEFTRFIHLKVVDIQNKSILIIECERVRRPVFLTVGKNEDFFIRSGPSSTKLSMSQMIKYLGER